MAYNGFKSYLAAKYIKRGMAINVFSFLRFLVN